MQDTNIIVIEIPKHYKILFIFFQMYMLGFTIFMMYYTYLSYNTLSGAVSKVKDITRVIEQICPILGINCTFII